MKKNIFIFSVIITAAILFYPQTTISLSTGSPGGKTGSPLDNTDCMECHGVGGTTSILTNINSNIPPNGYVPGNTYTITANINPTSILNGFEVTSEENTTNTKTGTFFITNTNETQLVNNNKSVTHTAAGNSMSTWNFDWEAPIIGTGDITFYGAFIEAGYPFGANFTDYFSSTTLNISEFIPSVPLTFVPDDNFENYLELTGAGNGVWNDNYVITTNITTLTTLNISNMNIADLTGLEDFTSLTSLYCDNNQLTNIDVGNNPVLEHFHCNNNQINTLDVSQNTFLTNLNCRYNQLSNLYINNNTYLTYLDCSTNNLNTLDVSNNTELTYLYCRDNQLTSLDVSFNTILSKLSCDENQLISLDVYNNTLLTQLECCFNQLTNLDLRNNDSLITLWCYSNQLTKLDLRNGHNINFASFSSTNNPNLYCISVDDTTYSSANWINIDYWTAFSSNCATEGCTDSLLVTEVVIDNSNLTMDIDVYNQHNYFLNYPHIALTIDANGDTIQRGNITLFTAANSDTTQYTYSILNPVVLIYPLTMYFVFSNGSLVTDTCILTYNNPTLTVITETNMQNNRKAVRIVDVLGREYKKNKNKLLLYIYYDGTVEKRITIK